MKGSQHRRGSFGSDPIGTLRTALCVPPGLGVPGWATRLLPAPASGTSPEGERPLSRVVFGVIDLETTGLSSRWSEILEIGLVVLRHGLKTRSFETLVRPDGAIPAAITLLTGIRAVDVEGAPEEGEAFDALHAVLREERVDALVAHNARFDRSFLLAAWERQSRDPPVGSFLCTVRLARRLVRAPRYGLDVLAEELGLLPRPRHRALGDAEIAADLFGELLRRAASRGIATLEALEALQSGPVPSRARDARASVDAPEPIR